MIWFFLGLTIGSTFGFVLGAVLASGKLQDEARLAYKEGYRVGSLDAKSGRI